MILGEIVGMGLLFVIVENCSVGCDLQLMKSNYGFGFVVDVLVVLLSRLCGCRF